eukprot:COSAG06_NODE_23954_length_676_cov_1.684575_1_plen_32_part_01
MTCEGLDPGVGGSRGGGGRETYEKNSGMADQC